MAINVKIKRNNILEFYQGLVNPPRGEIRVYVDET